MWSAAKTYFPQPYFELWLIAYILYIKLSWRIQNTIFLKLFIHVYHKMTEKLIRMTSGRTRHVYERQAALLTHLFWHLPSVEEIIIKHATWIRPCVKLRFVQWLFHKSSLFVIFSYNKKYRFSNYSLKLDYIIHFNFSKLHQIKNELK